MSNNMEDKRLENLKKNIAIYNFKEELSQNSNKNAFKSKENGKVFFMNRKIIATACASLVLVSGIVFATNIEKIKTHLRGLGEGVDTAVENGYIATPNVEFINVENVGVDVKLENFLMDDVNLSVNFVFDFDEKIINTIDMEKVNNIELSDLIVRDEENRIIYGGNNQERFQRYCEENNLNYRFCEFNNNYMNCGVNCFNVSHSKEDNLIRIMYNMYTDKFPKSKKLYFSFKNIEILEFNEDKTAQNKVIINGNWEISVDVPKEMYNRTEEYYEVVSCDDPDFSIYTAKVTNTGFEIGIIISNIKKPILDYNMYEKYSIATKKYNNGEISAEEYDEYLMWFWEFIESNHPIKIIDLISENSNISYIENEYGEKFECTKNASRNSISEFLDGDKFHFYETFGMTKYNATNNITVMLNYNGNYVTLQLKKVI